MVCVPTTKVASFCSVVVHFAGPAPLQRGWVLLVLCVANAGLPQTFTIAYMYMYHEAVRLH